MRSIWIAVGFVLGALVACAGGSANDGGEEAATDAGQDVDRGSPIGEDKDSSADASTAPDAVGGDEDPGELDTRGGTRTCSAAAVTPSSSHQAHTTVAWSKENTTINFASMTTTVTNGEGKDGNYLVVSVGTKGGNDYVEQFESGPILMSGVAVPVPLPPKFAIPAGKALRIDHYFVADGGPYSSPCFMYF